MIKVVSALLIFAFCGCLSADVHIIEEMHADAYYYGGVTQPAIDRTTELWIGDAILSQSAGNMQVIVDRASEQLTVVNHGDSTFVQCSLPFQWAELVSEEMAERLGNYQVRGNCGKTDLTREIRGRSCTCLEAESWIIVEETQYYPTEWASWLTTDLPIDWASFADMYKVLLQLANLQSDFVEELLNFEGYPLMVERKMYLKGFSRDETVEVTELSQQEAPHHVYAVPEGYSEKDHLSREELREL
jgi:hypothetical protein